MINEKKYNGKLNTVSLDFTIKEHFEKFVSRFGGAKNVEEKYPLVYEALTKQKNTSIDRGSCVGSKSDQGLDLLLVEATPITNETLDLSKNRNINLNTSSNTSSNAGQPCITSSGYAHHARPIPFAQLTGTLNVDEQGFLDSFAIYYSSEEDSNPNKDVSAVDLEDKLGFYLRDLIRVNERVIQSKVLYDGIDPEGNITSLEMDSGTTVLAATGSMVKKIHIDAPKNKKGIYNDPLILLLGRTEAEGETADYIYKDNKKDEDDYVDVATPLTGYIEFDPSYAPIGYSLGSTSSGLSLSFSDGGSVSYNHTGSEIAQYFTVDSENPAKLNFTFNEQWGTKLHTSAYGAKTVVLFNASFYVDAKDPIGGETSIGIVVASTDTKPDNGYGDVENGTRVYIPCLSIRWGCMAKDTKIRMADGSEKMISEIRVGDQLKTQQGVNTVKSVMTGYEETLVEITSEDGNRIRLTDTHPIATTNGIKAAALITTKDILLMANGAELPVKYVYLVDYKDTVYNIVTNDGPCMLHANGFLSGNYEAQCETERYPPVPSKPFSEPVLALAREMKRMMSDIHGTSLKRV